MAATDAEAPSFRLRHAAMVAAGIVWLAITGWSAFAGGGPWAWLVALQRAHLGFHEPNLTLGVLGAAGVGLVMTGLRGRIAPGEAGIAAASGGIRRRLLAAAWTLLALSLTMMGTSALMPSGDADPVAVVLGPAERWLDRGPVVVTGQARPERLVVVERPRLLAPPHVAYLPLVPPGWGPGEPIAVALRTWSDPAPPGELHGSPAGALRGPMLVTLPRGQVEPGRALPAEVAAAWRAAGSPPAEGLRLIETDDEFGAVALGAGGFAVLMAALGFFGGVALGAGRGDPRRVRP